MRRARLIAVILALAGRAHAAPNDDAHAHAAAVASFEEGVRLVQRGACEKAIPKFEQSLASEEGVGAHMNLADCQARLGHPARAWLEFKAAERLATLKGNDERREVAHEGAYRLESKLLRLTLTIPLAEGLVVTIDGTPIPRELVAARLVAIAPGAFTLVASANGKKPVTMQGNGAAGEAKPITIAFEDEPVEPPPPLVAPPPPPPPPAAPPPEEPPSSRGTIGLAVGAVGVGALAAGAVFGALALGARSDLDAARRTGQCRPDGSCPTAARSSVTGFENDAFRDAALSTVFFVAGGALAATGAVLYVTSPKRHAVTARLTISGCVLGGTW